MFAFFHYVQRVVISWWKQAATSNPTGHHGTSLTSIWPGHELDATSAAPWSADGQAVMGAGLRGSNDTAAIDWQQANVGAMIVHDGAEIAAWMT
jgi:hypothetical protein